MPRRLKKRGRKAKYFELFLQIYCIFVTYLLQYIL